MRSAPELHWKNFCMLYVSARPRKWRVGQGKSGRQPPTKPTPVSTPLKAEGSFIGYPFEMANLPFWSEISMWRCELASR